MHRNYKLVWLAIIFFPQLTSCFWQQSEAEKFAEMMELLGEKGNNTKLIVNSLTFNIHQQQSLPNWETFKIKIVENHQFYYMKSTYGSAGGLRDWASQNNFFLNIDEQGIALGQSLKNSAVMDPIKLMSLSDVSAYVLDAFQLALPNKPKPIFEQDEEHNDKAFYTRNLKIPVETYSYQDLVDLGTLIDGLPITFNYAELTVSKVDGLNGEITLLMVGTL